MPRELAPLDCEPAHRKISGQVSTSRDPPSRERKTFSIAFFALHQSDLDETGLRTTFRNVGDFTWNDLQAITDSGDQMPSAADIAALDPDAVIAVLSSSDATLVNPLFSRLRVGDPNRPILVASCGLTADEISQVLGQGASDFLLPPYRTEDLVPRLRRLLHPQVSCSSQVSQIKMGVGLRQIVGESPVFLAELYKVPRIASCDATVFIRGESGTGKEVFARAIHYLSARAELPFVPVNCGAIPEELAESELFGHRRGAFTGAVRDRIGLVAEADGGTMLLDEVDSLALGAQVKLLRFLERGEFRPVGTSKTEHASVRVIAATNADVEQMIQERKFREDLYYRLNVLRVVIPPLRERPGDLPLLALELLKKQSLMLRCVLKPLNAAALTCMAAYRWPGNVRELENVLARALIFSKSPEIQVEDLALPARLEAEVQGESFRMLKARVIEDFERAYLQTMLDRYGGNITRAAHAAAKNRRAFWELLRKHKLSLPRLRCRTGASGILENGSASIHAGKRKDTDRFPDLTKGISHV
jgi:DNA-binding NtrC family response regulator